MELRASYTIYRLPTRVVTPLPLKQALSPQVLRDSNIVDPALASSRTTVVSPHREHGCRHTNRRQQLAPSAHSGASSTPRSQLSLISIFTPQNVWIPVQQVFLWSWGVRLRKHHLVLRSTSAVPLHARSLARRHVRPSEDRARWHHKLPLYRMLRDEHRARARRDVVGWGSFWQELATATG